MNGSRVDSSGVYNEPSNTPRIGFLPESMLQDLQDSNQALAALLANLRGRVLDIRQQASELREQIGALPPEAMDPQQASGRSRPTATATLNAIPRIVLQENMSMMQQATIQFGKTTQLDAVSGDFGPTPPIHLTDKPLVLAEPRTGKGGKLTDTTKAAAHGGSILYMERGDGISFVRKAMMAQNAGASAVVIGNNTSIAWPYIMKDSVGEHRTLGLKIPVVMVKQSDGQLLVKACQETTQTCTFSIRPATNECIICVERLGVGQTVLQLPDCAHVFHETCAMTWLKTHNSCPYCRRELPTDDEEYEAERRRTQRTHAGSNTTTSSSHEANGQAFYG